MIIRPALPTDLEPILKIYNHYILQTTATFDLEQRSSTVPPILDQTGENGAQSAFTFSTGVPDGISQPAFTQ